MAQHVSSDKRKEKARSAWGTAESMDSIKALFSKAVSEGGVFPWAEAGLPKAAVQLAQQLQALINEDMLPINALPAVRIACDQANMVAIAA